MRENSVGGVHAVSVANARPRPIAGPTRQRHEAQRARARHADQAEHRGEELQRFGFLGVDGAVEAVEVVQALHPGPEHEEGQVARHPLCCYLYSSQGEAFLGGVGGPGHGGHHRGLAVCGHDQCGVRN